MFVNSEKSMDLKINLSFSYSTHPCKNLLAGPYTILESSRVMLADAILDFFQLSDFMSYHSAIGESFLEIVPYKYHLEISPKGEAWLAQSVEHETLNLRVVGSSPTLGDHNFSNHLSFLIIFVWLCLSLISTTILIIKLMNSINS